MPLRPASAAAEQHRDTKQKAHFQNPSITVPMQSTCVCSLRLTQIGRIHSERTFFALYKGFLAVSRKAPLLLGCTGCCEGSTYSCSVSPLTKLSFIAYMSLLLSNCDKHHQLSRLQKDCSVKPHLGNSTSVPSWQCCIPLWRSYRMIVTMTSPFRLSIGNPEEVKGAVDAWIRR